MEALGFHVGDYIAVDANPQISENGFINARHLDDKAGVSLVLGAAKAVWNEDVPLPVTCNLLFTISEEVGIGASAGPFDYHLSHRLIKLCKQHEIPCQREVFKHYKSDSASALAAGNDLRTALVCFGVDASHGYERTNIHSLRSVAELFTLYMQTGLTCPRDRMKIGPLEGFIKQPT